MRNKESAPLAIGRGKYSREMEDMRERERREGGREGGRRRAGNNGGGITRLATGRRGGEKVAASSGRAGRMEGSVRKSREINL